MGRLDGERHMARRHGRDARGGRIESGDPSGTRKHARTSQIASGREKLRSASWKASSWTRRAKPLGRGDQERLEPGDNDQQARPRQMACGVQPQPRRGVSDRDFERGPNEPEAAHPKIVRRGGPRRRKDVVSGNVQQRSSDMQNHHDADELRPSRRSTTQPSAIAVTRDPDAASRAVLRVDPGDLAAHRAFDGHDLA